MPRQLLCDSLEFKPSADSTKSITEALAAGNRKFPLPISGRLSVCDSLNGNGRKYPKRVWEKNLSEGSELQTGIKRRSAFGLLEHPGDGKMDLRSPISHVLTKVWMEGSEIFGEITLINTAEGHKLAALIETGYNPTVSSRGYGSVEKNAAGEDIVQEDFVCESWDVVFTPSFKTAELDGAPFREAMHESAPAVLDEDAKCDAACDEVYSVVCRAKGEGKLVDAHTITKKGNKVVIKYGGKKPRTVTINPKDCTAKPKSDEAPVAAAEVSEALVIQLAESESGEPIATPSSGIPPVVSVTPNTMDLKQLSESVGSLVAMPTATLAPKALAEARTKADQLHREISAAAATAPQLAWDASKMHESLTAFERSIDEAIDAPRRQVVKLQEQQTKTLKVVKIVSEAGLGFKTRLAKALTENRRTTKISEVVSERARGWEKRARLSEKRLEVALASLDEFTSRYNEDTTALGRRLITLEFAPKDAAVLEKLEKATTPDDLVPIRESLKAERKALAEAEGKKLGADGKPITEAAPAPAAAPAAAPVATFESHRRPFTISESVGVSQRLTAGATCK